MYRASLGIFNVHVQHQPRQSAYLSFCICMTNFIQIGPYAIYDVISIFQDGGHGIAMLLSVSVFVTSLIWEGRNLHAYQIRRDISIHG